MAAHAAIKKKGSFYQAKHNSLRFKLGSYNKATVAIANRLARTIYHIIKEEQLHFQDIGSERGDPKNRQAKRLITKLRKLGYDVTLTQTQI